MVRLRRGLTLIELLVAMVITSIVLGMAFWGIMSLQTLWNSIMDQNALVAQNRAALNVVADHLRNAQPCSDSTKGNMNAVIHSGGAASVTYYGDANCSKVTYTVSSGGLYRQAGSSTTLISPNVTGFTVQFATTPTATYNFNTNSAWAHGSKPSFTANPNSPSTLEAPALCAALVTVTTTLDGQSMSSSTWVRLRNSPKKTNVSGS